MGDSINFCPNCGHDLSVYKQTDMLRSFDELYCDALNAIVKHKKVSTSILQKELCIGYGRAARMMDKMEEDGLISSADGAKPRTVMLEALKKHLEGQTKWLTYYFDFLKESRSPAEFTRLFCSSFRHGWLRVVHDAGGYSVCGCGHCESGGGMG